MPLFAKIDSSTVEPEDIASYLKENTWYKVIDIEDNSLYTIEVPGEDRDAVLIFPEECAHLSNGKWILQVRDKA